MHRISKIMKSFTLIITFLGVLTCCYEPNQLQVNSEQSSPSNRIRLKIENCSWFTIVHHAPRMDFGNVMLSIQGKTNAEKLTILTYGDGLRSDRPIVINPNGSFSDTIQISFIPITYGSVLPKSFNSQTILKAYLNSETFDTTFYSGNLHFEL